MKKESKWSGILYPVIIALLFIPLAFMGANVFFEEEQYNWDNCYYPKAVASEPTQTELDEQERCNKENQVEQERVNDANKIVQGYKYVFVTILSLIALLVALFVPVVSYIKQGLFLGAVLTAFFSTWTYFQARSKIGFVILVGIFVLSLGHINRKK